MLDGDGAINLSTSQRPSAATTPNDSLHQDDVEQQAASLEKVLKDQQQHQQLDLERSSWDQDRKKLSVLPFLQFHKLNPN